MIFYNKKNRTGIAKFCGYFICLSCFFIACYLNAQQTDIVLAHFMFVLSLTIGFITYTINNKVKNGVISASQQGLRLSAGLRTVNINWETIKKITKFSKSNKIFLGISLKNIDFAKRSFKRILELNKEHTGYEFCFNEKYLEESAEIIATKLNQYLKDENLRQSLPQAPSAESNEK